MTRKSGDYNYQFYVGWQAFSTDEPCHRINQTKWYLKHEHGKPGFFINTEKENGLLVFRQMPNECFKATVEAKSQQENFVGYQQQVEKYFNLTMEKICPIKEKTKKRLFTTV